MHIAPLIQDLAVILGVAAVITYLFKLIKQPVVLGYIAAGLVVGPYSPSVFSLIDTENVKIWAELGVIFLMFNLGLEFSFRRLMRLGPSAGLTGLFQIIVMVFLGYYLAKAFGWTKFDSIFLGCMIAISSTTIIIKAFEELKLKNRRFAELVFGILIVEDLAAILMLVGLTSFATQSLVDPGAILISGIKLVFVVSIWIIFGIFWVPRIISKIAERGNDEMLTITAIGLCLIMVTIAAKYNYSVALGAFIMGSILSETTQVKRIEHLIAPLKDVFGAIFFVSVGMLLDPKVIVDNFWHVALLSLVIIIGKVISVFIGSLATGQTLKTSVHASFSKAQIGEFSFIIAALGQSLNVINAELYPIIVASSLFTTFTTPYMIKFSLRFSDRLDASVPKSMATALSNYRQWFQRHTSSSDQKRKFMNQALRIMGHGVVILAIFVFSSRYVPRWLDRYVQNESLSRTLAWLVTMIACSPFFWAMLSVVRTQEDRNIGAAARRKININLGEAFSYVCVFFFIAFISAEFFSGWISLVFFLAVFVALFTIFRSRVGTVSVALEKRFMEGFAQDTSSTKINGVNSGLVPWDAHLVPLFIPPTAKILGYTLHELKLREKYGVNVIAIERGSQQIIAPGAGERVYPHDTLLCFASDKEFEVIKDELLTTDDVNIADSSSPGRFTLRQVIVPASSPLIGKSLRETDISAKFNCLAVGVERNQTRIKSPKSDFRLAANDTLWLIGDPKNSQKFIDSVYENTV